MSNATFWNDVFIRLENMKSVAVDDEEALPNLQANIGHIAEVYGGCFDPAEQFQEYVLVRLLQEINAKLPMTITGE